MTPRKTELDKLAISLLLACCALWGLQQVLIKATITEIPPMFQASLRLVGATVLLWLWCLVRGVVLFKRDGSLAMGLLAGALFAGEFACIYAGLVHTSSSRLTVFLYTSPFVVALLLPRFVPTERLRGVQWLGLGIAFVSVAVAFIEGFLPGAAAKLGANHLRGDAFALAAGVFWGLTTIVIRTTVLATASAEKTLFYQLAVAACLSPFASLALGESWQLNYSGFAWLSLVVQTVVGAFISYLAWMWMLRHYPATQMSSFVFLTPVFALVFGGLWLNEAMTVQLLVGLVGVALGILLVNRR